jgi:hypothetical protein
MREVIRPSLVIAAVCVSVVTAAPGQSRIQRTQVVDVATKADFVAVSRVDEMTATTSRLSNAIENHADIPLSVEWPDGGIFCSGYWQIPPHASQNGRSNGSFVYNPKASTSELRYGGLHQYPHSALVYVEQPATSAADHFESEYDRRLPNVGPSRRPGDVSDRIRVDSRIVDGGRSAALELEMPSGSVIGVPVAIGAALRDALTKAGQDWRALETVGAEKFAGNDKRFLDVARTLLGTDGVLQLVTPGAPGGTAKLALTIPGTGWTPRRVFFAVTNADRAGVLAFAVNVFVPREAPGVGQ